MMPPRLGSRSGDEHRPRDRHRRCAPGARHRGRDRRPPLIHRQRLRAGRRSARMPSRQDRRRGACSRRPNSRSGGLRGGRRAARRGDSDQQLSDPHPRGGPQWSRPHPAFNSGDAGGGGGRRQRHLRGESGRGPGHRSSLPVKKARDPDAHRLGGSSGRSRLRALHGRHHSWPSARPRDAAAAAATAGRGAENGRDFRPPTSTCRWLPTASNSRCQ